MPADQVLFTEVPGTPGFFDMTVNRRGSEYNVIATEFAEAVRRRRLSPDVDIWVQHSSGRRERLATR